MRESVGAQNVDCQQKRLGLSAVFVGTAASAVMQTFLTLNLPTLSVELKAVEWYGWVTGVYFFTSTVCIPWLSKLTDAHGSRLIYTISMLIWIIGTIGLVIAQGPFTLLLARAIQGIGTAGIVPAGMAAVAYYTGVQFGRFVGMMAAVQSIFTALGAPLGGMLEKPLGWRGSLGFVVIFMIIALCLSAIALPRSCQTDRNFVKWLEVVKNRVVCKGIFNTIALASVYFGIITYIPLLFSATYGISTSTVSFLLLPTFFGTALGALIGGTHAEKKFFEIIIWIIISLGCVFCITSSIVLISIGSALAAVGAGAGIARELVIIKNSALSNAAGSASGIIQTARNVGGFLSMSLLTVPFQMGFDSSKGALIVLIAVAIFSVVVLVVVLASFKPRNHV